MLNNLNGDCIILITKFLDVFILPKFKLVNKYINSIFDENTEEDIFENFEIRDIGINNIMNFKSWKQFYFFCFNIKLTGEWNILNKFNSDIFNIKNQNYKANFLEYDKNKFRANGYINEMTVNNKNLYFQTILNFKIKNLFIYGLTFFFEKDSDEKNLLGISWFHGNISINNITINYDENNNISFDNIEIISKFIYNPTKPSAFNFFVEGESFSIKL